MLLLAAQLLEPKRAPIPIWSAQALAVILRVIIAAWLRQRSRDGRRPNIGPAGRVLQTRLRRRAGAHLARRGMAIRGISRIPCEECGVHVKDTSAIGAAIRRCV